MTQEQHCCSLDPKKVAAAAVVAVVARQMKEQQQYALEERPHQPTLKARPTPKQHPVVVVVAVVAAWESWEAHLACE